MRTHSRDSIQCTAMSSYWSRYCCDPFKHHRRRIYSPLRVVPASLIAEHPSLSLQSGVIACCNCLKAIRECSPESSGLIKTTLYTTCSMLGLARSLLGPAHSNKGTLGSLDSGEHSRIAFRQLQQAMTPLCSERDGCSAINDAGTTRRCEYIRRRWCLKGSQQYRLQ